MDSNFYLLVFPAQNAFKIGKANDIQSRIQTLARLWGDVDYAASYYFEATEEEVFNLEAALKRFFVSRGVKDLQGEGKTEFFQMDIIQNVVDMIQIYLSMNKITETLKQGIPEPVIPDPIPKEEEDEKKIKPKDFKVVALRLSLSKFEEVDSLRREHGQNWQTLLIRLLDRYLREKELILKTE